MMGSRPPPRADPPVYSGVPCAPRACAIWLVLASAGCVNNYIVDESGGDATTIVDGSTSLGGTGPSVTGTSESGLATAADDTAGIVTTGTATGSAASEAGSSSEGTGSTGTPPPLESCQPCRASAQCGDRFDLCTALGRTAVCLNNCSEAPEECPAGLSCMDLESVDGMMMPLCVPDSGSCGDG